MNEILEAFLYLETQFKTIQNPNFFKTAKESYNKLGRGGFIITYAKVEDCYCPTNQFIQYFPIPILKKEGDPCDLETLNTYNPNKQFVVIVTIGQNGDLEKQTLCKTFVIDYMGEKAEKKMLEETIEINELHNRLAHKKSFRCDQCGQKRKIDNLLKYESIFVFCNNKCLCASLNNFNFQRIRQWYHNNKSALNRTVPLSNINIKSEQEK